MSPVASMTSVCCLLARLPFVYTGTSYWNAVSDVGTCTYAPTCSPSSKKTRFVYVVVYWTVLARTL